MITKDLQKKIATLPPELLEKVEEFIASLKETEVGITTRGKKKLYNVFDEISNTAEDIGIKDWARNHDHYLYGVEKR